MKRLRMILLVMTLLVAAERPALALASCLVVATPIGFGNYDFLSPTPVKTTGTITVSCSLLLGISLLVAYNIALSQGSSGTYTARTLRNGGNALSYNVYTTNANNAVWGNGSAGTSTVSDAYLLGLGGATTPYTVYATLPPSQIVPGGLLYSDTIIVTVSY